MSTKKVLEIALGASGEPVVKKAKMRGRHYVSGTAKKNGNHENTGISAEPQNPEIQKEFSFEETQVQLGMRGLAEGMTKYDENLAAEEESADVPAPLAEATSEPTTPDVPSDVPVINSDKTPLRLLFENKLEQWSETRAYEAKRLADHLQAWALSRAASETQTIWELIENHIVILTINKSAAESARRLHDPYLRLKDWKTGPVSAETTINWLFGSNTADEWMQRLTRRFEKETFSPRDLIYDTWSETL